MNRKNINSYSDSTRCGLRQAAVLCVVASLLFAMIWRTEAQNMTGETVPQSQAVLDSWFVTNAVPGQLAYWSLIDTMFYYIQATYTNATAAQQAAATVSNAEYCVTAVFNFTNLNSSVGQMTVSHINGYSTNYAYWTSCGFNVTNIFSIPMPDMLWTNGIREVWIQDFTKNGNDFTNCVPTWNACNQTQFVFRVVGDCPSTDDGEFYLQIFK